MCPQVSPKYHPVQFSLTPLNFWVGWNPIREAMTIQIRSDHDFYFFGKAVLVVNQQFGYLFFGQATQEVRLWFTFGPFASKSIGG